MKIYGDQYGSYMIVDGVPVRLKDLPSELKFFIDTEGNVINKSLNNKE